MAAIRIGWDGINDNDRTFLIFSSLFLVGNFNFIILNQLD